MIGKEARLLIVDDESHIREVLHDFLSQSYDCVALNSGEDALALLLTESFDVIISDIKMARMSGLEMVPHILNLEPEAVIIMISGQRTIEFAIFAMRARRSTTSRNPLTYLKWTRPSDGRSIMGSYSKTN